MVAESSRFRVASGTVAGPFTPKGVAACVTIYVLLYIYTTATRKLLSGSSRTNRRCGEPPSLQPFRSEWGFARRRERS